jgi:hypothetical protein
MYRDFRDWCDSSATTGQLWVSLSLIYSYSANVIGDGDRNTKKLKQVVLPDVFIVHRKRNRNGRNRNRVRKSCLFCYPNRLCELESMFNRDLTVLSRIANCLTRSSIDILSTVFAVTSG